MKSSVDWWSFVHFLVGAMYGWVATRFWSPHATTLVGVVLHQVWELWENSESGKSVWNVPWVFNLFQNLGPLKFDEYHGDGALNSAADTLCFTLGLASVLYGNSNKVS